MDHIKLAWKKRCEDCHEKRILDFSMGANAIAIREERDGFGRYRIRAQNIPRLLDAAVACGIIGCFFTVTALSLDRQHGGQWFLSLTL